MNKPRLTARIARGLESVRCLADVNMFEGSDLYAVVAGDKDDAKKRAAIQEIDDAVAWLGSLLHWYETKAKGR